MEKHCLVQCILLFFSDDVTMPCLRKARHYRGMKMIADQVHYLINGTVFRARCENLDNTRMGSVEEPPT
jgi:hypothetical protein